MSRGVVAREFEDILVAVELATLGGHIRLTAPGHVTADSTFVTAETNVITADNG